MTPIPGEPLEPKPPELTMKDGRKVTLRVPGLAGPLTPTKSEVRGAAESPRDDPRPVHDPNHYNP